MVSVENAFDKLISLLKLQPDCPEILVNVKKLKNRYMKLDNMFICDVCGKQKRHNLNDILDYMGNCRCSDCDRERTEKKKNK